MQNVNEFIEGFRVSPQQSRLWLLQQSGGSAPFIAQCSVAIEGALSTTALQAAIYQVIARHEILRTTFCVLPSMTIPLQAVSDFARVDFSELDFSSLPSDRQAQKIEEIIAGDSAAPFRFDNGPLIRARLAKLADEQHSLTLTLPALVADRFALVNLVKEIARFYEACLCGEPAADEPLQYVDIAQWQNELFEDEESEAASQYWRELDLSAISSLKLPFENQTSSKAAFNPKRESFAVEPAIASELKAIADGRGVEVSDILLACWFILIYRLSGQSEIIIGAGSDCRDYEGLDAAIGLLAKRLPIHCRLHDGSRLGEILDQIKESGRNSSQWQEAFTWERILRRSDDPSEESFFPVAFDCEDQVEVFAGDAASFSVNILRACYDRSNLSLRAIRRPATLSFELQYDACAFSETSAKKYAAQFATLLESLARQPEIETGALEITTVEEHRQLLVDFNNTVASYPSNLCFHELFEQQCKRAPENVAVRFGETLITYAELNARSNQLARYLGKLGAGPETRVAIYVERSVEMAVGLLAILKAGAAYVPLDTSYPKDRLSYMLEDSSAKAILTNQRLAAALATESARQTLLDADWPEIARESEANFDSGVGPENLAYLIYTSGSTGKPKGVMIEHRGLVNYLTWAARNYKADEGGAVPVHSPVGFDLTITSLFAPLLVGQTVWLLPEDEGVEALTNALNCDSDFSLVKITPAHLELLSQCLEPRQAAGSARAFVIGGEALTNERLRFWRDQAPGSRLINEYGPTETVVGCCVYEVTNDAPATGPVPIGRPIANTQLYIVNSCLRPTPQLATGELLIGGAGLARGYFNRPDITAERFIPDPFGSKPGARLYKTGDLARHLIDGNIEFLGRNDEQVKIRGFRIELGEIEEAINCCAGIKESIAVACDDKQGGKRLVAFVVAEDGGASAPAQLRSSLRERLPEHMIPATFISIDELPMTPNGKADRRALIARAENEAETEDAFSPAATAIEEILAGIYAEVLNLGRVSANGNFFELGGHSLLATRLLSRVRESFQVELQLRTVFEAPTVSALASEIEKAIKSGDGSLIPPMTRAPRDAALPMSFAQQRLWFLNQLEPDAPIYNDPSCVRLTGYLDVEALGKTFSEIVRRHEVLRTSFCLQNGSPVQVIAPAQELPFPIIDLSELSEQEREAEAARLMPIEASRLFDLAKGPMFRVSLVRLSERAHVVFLTMHHIITDGWSAGIIVREIATLYEAFSQGKPSPLPELPLQYADFGRWQREWLQGEALAAQVAYWKQKLGGAPELLDLPTDRPRPPARSLRGEQQTAIINNELYEGLRSLSRAQGATLFMTLLAAFKTLLYRYSDQSDLCIGTPIAGRNRLETEGLIGFFVNTLVLRTDLSGDPSFCDLLGRVRETTLGAYAHQDLPFEKIVEEIRPQRSASYTPMFQVMFALENVPAETLEAQGLTLEPVQGKRETSKFDMALYLHETGSEMLAVLEYSSDLFEAETAIRLLAQYEALLASILRDPQRRLSELSLSAEADRNRLLLDFNEEFGPVEFAS